MLFARAAGTAVTRVYAIILLACVFAPTDARAQFACDLTTNVTCTNTGVAADLVLPPLPLDVYAINSGSAQNITVETTAGPPPSTGYLASISNSNTAFNLSAIAHDNGSALILNTGMAVDLLAHAESGSATVNNTGLAAFANSIEAWTDNGGDAIANNSGAVTGEVLNSILGTISGIGIFTHVDNSPLLPGGAAITNNSGSVSQSILTWNYNGGLATASNSGSVGGAVVTVTGSGGNASTSNNSPGAADALMTLTLGGGNATTSNSGTVVNTVGISSGGAFDSLLPFGFSSLAPNGAGIFTGTYTGGDALTIDTGTSLGMIVTATGLSGGDGNATTVNYGSVVGGLTTVTGFQGGSGDALTTNYGNVRGDIYTSAADGFFGSGNARFDNFGHVTSDSQGVSVLAAGGNATFNNTTSATIDVSNATFASSPFMPGIVVATTSGGDASATNAGLIIGNLNTVTGFFGGGGNATTTNSGMIQAGGIQTVALGDGNATTTNSGMVGGPISTVTSGIGDATTTNFGTVNGDVLSLAQSPWGPANASIVNYGTITPDFNGVGAIAFDGSAILQNFGTIDLTKTAFGFVQVQSVFGNATAYNTGRIIGGIGVFSELGSAALTNAGLIDGSKTQDGIAIDLRQSDPATPTTLNLLTGSRILGTIRLNGDTTDPASVGTRVNIESGRGLSSVLTFGGPVTCGCAGGPGGLIDTGAAVNVTGGRPYVVSGNSVAILDPTSFAAQDRNVFDFTRTVLSAASSRLTSPVPMSGDGSAAIGFAPSGNVARDMANDAFANIPALSYAAQDRVLRSNPNFTAADGTSVWAQGFGGVRVQNADGPNLRSVNQFYGGMIGLDRMVRPDMRLGGFAGGGTITSQIDMNSGRTTSDTGFGGIFGRYAMNRAFLDFALLAGGSSNNVKRTMTNNLAVGGYEYANANYSGWFISPELAYGVRHDLTKDWTLTPTARVRYLAANFGGYQENGSSSNLTAAGRTTHNFEERGELVFTRTTSEREGSRLQLNATLGAVAWQRAGGDGINTVLLGQALAFATPGKASVFGGYLGGGFNWLQASGFSVFGAAEVTAMSDSSHTITGHGGVKLAF